MVRFSVLSYCHLKMPFFLFFVVKLIKLIVTNFATLVLCFICRNAWNLNFFLTVFRITFRLLLLLLTFKPILFCWKKMFIDKKNNLCQYTYLFLLYLLFLRNSSSLRRCNTIFCTKLSLRNFYLACFA